MLNLKSGKHFTDTPTITRGGFLKGILASGIAPSLTLGAVSLVGSANASVGSAARGMMRCVGARFAMMSGKNEDNRWAQEVMEKDYPTENIIEEHHNARYTEELTKAYGGH